MSGDADKGTEKYSPKKNKLIVACCVVIVAYYIHGFIQNRGQSDPIVQTKNGKIRGRIGTSRGGKEFYEFLGIPYALPPVGNLRFMSPVPATDWKGILSTRRFKPKCMQVDLISQLKSGSDDCLYLNVYMPKKVNRTNNLLPVMAFIHGGYYVSGHPSLYGPSYLMDEDIVLVTISYRLGALGFLNLGIKEARGNQGLKDQVLALTWIKENIHQFGGDPNLVTIIGQSAGGSSVHFHMLSPMSKGLFHRAVSHSGTVLSPWAISYSGKEQAFRLAELLDCGPVNDTKAVLNCMKHKDVNKIVEAHSENIYFLHDPLSVFKPSIEEIDDEDAFLTQDPVEIMKSGNIPTRVPWIIGVNSEEGLAVASILVRDNSLLQLFQEDWQQNFRKLLLYTTSDESLPEKIRSYYFGSQSTFSTQENKGNFTKLFSDREYFLGAHQSAAYHHTAKTSPVYLFYFNQYVPLSFGEALWAQYGVFPAFVEIGVFLLYSMIQRNIFGWINPDKGVTHVDDFTFIFQIANVPEYNGGDNDGYNMLSKEMVRSWTAFAKDGKPAKIFGTDWNQAFLCNQVLNKQGDISNPVPVPRYLKIKIDSPVMIDEPFNDAVKFWSSLNFTVYRRGKGDTDFLTKSEDAIIMES